jgi:hypothetical protein
MNRTPTGQPGQIIQPAPTTGLEPPFNVRPAAESGDWA